MTHTARYAITYTGTGIMRLPRAGIFQEGTRAVVDETIARIAVAHGCFIVVPLDNAVPLAVAPEATPAPVAAATPPARKTQRRSAIHAVAGSGPR